MGFFLYQVLPLEMTIPADNYEVIKFFAIIVLGAMGAVLVISVLAFIFGKAWQDLKEWWEWHRW